MNIELINNKEIEFNDFFLEIKKNEEYFKTLNYNNIEEIIFFSAKKIEEVFFKNKYSELSKNNINNKNLLTINIKLLLNNILKISIEKDFLKKNLKIDLSKSFNYLKKEHVFKLFKNKELEINNLIIIKKGDYVLYDKNNNAISIKEKNIKKFLEENIGLNINKEDLDLVDVFLKDEQINYIYQIDYDNQLFFNNEYHFKKE